MLQKYFYAIVCSFEKSFPTLQRNQKNAYIVNRYQINTIGMKSFAPLGEGFGGDCIAVW